MNVKLTTVVSDITRVTGLGIIRAIVAGERDPNKVAGLREPGCARSEEEIARATTATARRLAPIVYSMLQNRTACADLDVT